MEDSAKRLEDVGRKKPTISLFLFYHGQHLWHCVIHLPRFQLLLGDPGPQALVNDLFLSSLQPWCVRDLQLLLTLGYLAVT